ncbi:MAG: hypothetical protein LBF24_03050 [Puniceicoccales bacterium]|nr:hypothetical protein [Puniceicoccales bacterium]
MKNFGDSVIYIDHDISPLEMFKQIDGHMRRILENPQEATELARRAHRIFAENFSMEKEVDKIDRFFREIIAENNTTQYARESSAPRES